MPQARVPNGGICDLSCATAAGQNAIHQVIVLPRLPSPGLHAGDNGMDAYRQIVLASRPIGIPTPGDFRLETGPLPIPSDGQLLLRTQYLSLDPYMRGRMNDAKSYAPPVELGQVMEGEVIAEFWGRDIPAIAQVTSYGGGSVGGRTPPWPPKPSGASKRAAMPPQPP